MKIENYAVPVMYEFKNLNEGEVFLSPTDKSFVFIKITDSCTNDCTGTGDEFNAVCLNDGDTYFFDSHDEVEVVCASLTIEPKMGK